MHSLSSDMRGVWGERQCIRVRIHNSTLCCISTVEIEKYICLLYLGGLLYIDAQAINIEYDYSDLQTSSE